MIHIYVCVYLYIFTHVYIYTHIYIIYIHFNKLAIAEAKLGCCVSKTNFLKMLIVIAFSVKQI